MQEPPVRRDDVEGGDVVAGKSETPSEAAGATAQGQACRAGVGDGSRRRRQPEYLGFAVQLAEQGPRFELGSFCLGIDPAALHGRGVDQDAAVAGGLAGEAVSATANRRE